MQMKSKNIPLLSTIAVSLYPVIFLFTNNITSVRVEETLYSAGILLLFSLLFFLISLFIVRDVTRANLVVCIMVLLFSYYKPFLEFFNRFIPQLRYWHLSILMIMLVANIALLINEHITIDTAGKISLVILVIFGGLSLINFVTKIPIIVKAASVISSASQANPIGVNGNINNTEKNLPNFYYLIFDEFGGYDNIKRYCNYDSNIFFDELDSMGFSVSLTSSNPTIDTYTELPNLLQLRRVNSGELPAVQKKENALNPQLLLLMKSFGYKINQIDSHPYFLDVNLADFKFSPTQKSSYGTFDSLIIEQTALYPFYGKNDKDYEANLIINKLDYIKESSTLMDEGLFTVAYFNFPHLPFVFDEDGNIVDDQRRGDVLDPGNYLGQYKFASKKILELVSHLLVNDPDAIIVLQSDHGFRYPNLINDWYGDDRFNLADEFYYQRNILNAVYHPQEKMNIEGLSGVETLRQVLNAVYNIKFLDE